MTVRTDTGPFSLIPEWVLDAEISHAAVRLYCLLGRYADKDGQCWPSRRTLADRMRCSVDTLDRAVHELEAVKALSKTAQRSENGDQTSNLWVVARMRLPGRVDAATPGRVDAAQNENQLEREPRKGRRRSTAAPPAWEITDEMAAWAARTVPELDLVYATREWLAYVRANDRRYVDWVQAWRNGMLKAQRWHLQPRYAQPAR